MKRVITVFVTALMALVLLSYAAFAENFPNAASASPGDSRLTKAQMQQQMYYGYVPPAPIRHTWPGGYRNIFHELFNTLSEHILGQY